MYLSDDDIARLSEQERAALIARLAPKTPDLPSSAQVRRARGVRLSVMTFGSAALIPWTIYLALTLPTQYTSPNWRLTWVGFDVLLVTCMGATAYFGWKRRPQTMFPAFATGVLLLADAWFDLTTSAANDRPLALASAMLIEVPLAVLLLVGAWRILNVLTDASEWLVPFWKRQQSLHHHPAGGKR